MVDVHVHQLTCLLSVAAAVFLFACMCAPTITRSACNFLQRNLDSPLVPVDVCIGYNNGRPATHPSSMQMSTKFMCALSGAKNDIPVITQYQWSASADCDSGALHTATSMHVYSGANGNAHDLHCGSFTDCATVGRKYFVTHFADDDGDSGATPGVDITDAAIAASFLPPTAYDFALNAYRIAFIDIYGVKGCESSGSSSNSVEIQCDTYSTPATKMEFKFYENMLVCAQGQTSADAPVVTTFFDGQYYTQTATPSSSTSAVPGVGDVYYFELKHCLPDLSLMGSGFFSNTNGLNIGNSNTGNLIIIPNTPEPTPRPTPVVTTTTTTTTASTSTTTRAANHTNGSADTSVGAGIAVAVEEEEEEHDHIMIGFNTTEDSAESEAIVGGGVEGEVNGAVDTGMNADADNSGSVSASVSDSGAGNVFVMAWAAVPSSILSGVIAVVLFAVLVKNFFWGQRAKDMGIWLKLPALLCSFFNITGIAAVLTMDVILGNQDFEFSHAFVCYFILALSYVLAKLCLCLFFVVRLYHSFNTGRTAFRYSIRTYVILLISIVMVCLCWCYALFFDLGKFDFLFIVLTVADTCLTFAFLYLFVNRLMSLAVYQASSTMMSFGKFSDDSHNESHHYSSGNNHSTHNDSSHAMMNNCNSNDQDSSMNIIELSDNNTRSAKENSSEANNVNTSNVTMLRCVSASASAESSSSPNTPRPLLASSLKSGASQPMSITITATATTAGTNSAGVAQLPLTPTPAPMTKPSHTMVASASVSSMAMPMAMPMPMTPTHGSSRGVHGKRGAETTTLPSSASSKSKMKMQMQMDMKRTLSAAQQRDVRKMKNKLSDNELLFLVTRCSILSAVSMLTTNIFGVFLFFFDELGVEWYFVTHAIWAIDMLINIICLFLNFYFSNRIYRVGCKWCHAVCAKGFQKIAVDIVLNKSGK